MTVSNDTLAINTTSFLVVFEAFLLFLNSYNVEYALSVSPFYVVWGHRLNYDAHSFNTGIRMTDVDGRLNGVVSLVTVFEELFNVTSLFWSRDKVNREIRLFHEAIDAAASTWDLPPLPSRPEKSKWLPPFVAWTCIHVPWVHCGFFIAWDSSFLVGCCIQCYMLLIILSVLFPTEYSVRLLSPG